MSPIQIRDSMARELTRDEIAGALMRIDPNCDRETWLAIGRALHSVGDSFLPLWEDWTKGKRDSSRPKKVDAQWKSFAKGAGKQTIGLGSLVYHAKKTGWIDPRRSGRSQQARVAPTYESTPEREEDRKTIAKTLEYGGYKIAAEYEYSETYFVYRLEHSSKPKRFGQVSFKGDTWSATAPDSPRPLFRLDQILEADPSEEIYLVEGEKCVEAAESLGLLATTSPQGANSFALTNWEPLRGRRVVITPDRDKEGEIYAAGVEKILRALGCEIRVVRLQSTRQETNPPKFDLADWIAEQDSTETERLSKALQTLAYAAKVVARLGGASLLDDLDGFELDLADTHGREFLGLPSRLFPRLDSLLDGWQGFGVLAAEPGIGKTTLLLQIGLGIVANNPDACFVFFSLEMGRATMKRRLASQSTRIPSRILRKGNWLADAGRDGLMFNAEERVRFAEGMANLRKLAPRISLIETADLGDMRKMEHDDIRALLVQKVESFKAQSGCARAFVLVDHLARVPIARGSATTSLEADDARIALMLETQRRLEDPLVVISQIRKSDFANPTNASARGSAEIIYAPDFLITLTKKKEDEDPYAMIKAKAEIPVETFFDAEIVKGRDEMIRGRVPMRFIVGEQRIEEVVQ